MYSISLHGIAEMTFQTLLTLTAKRLIHT